MPAAAGWEDPLPGAAAAAEAELPPAAGWEDPLPAAAAEPEPLPAAVEPLPVPADALVVVEVPVLDDDPEAVDLLVVVVFVAGSSSRNTKYHRATRPPMASNRITPPMAIFVALDFADGAAA